jgi:ribosome-binding factor A
MLHRAERLAESLKEVVAEIVGFELSDPRIQNATVTDVRVAENLRNANVYVLVEGNEEGIKEALLALGRATTFIRQQVALEMNLRYAPQLHFARDTVEENATRIGEILDDLVLSEEIENEEEVNSGE